MNARRGRSSQGPPHRDAGAAPARARRRPARAGRAVRRRGGARRQVQATGGRTRRRRTAPAAGTARRPPGAPARRARGRPAVAPSPRPASCRSSPRSSSPPTRCARWASEHGHPLREQVFWLEDGRCLRPMLAPNLYTLLRRLGRIWSRPFGIFEIGPCFRRDSKGASHLNEFTMLNLVELGRPQPRVARGSRSWPRSSWTRPASRTTSSCAPNRRSTATMVDVEVGGRRGMLRRPRPAPARRQLGHRRPVGRPGLRPRTAAHGARGLPQHRARRPQPELRGRSAPQHLTAAPAPDARRLVAGAEGPRGGGACAPPPLGPSVVARPAYLPSRASIFLTPSLASSA